MASRAKRITFRDISFLRFSFEEYLALLRQHKSCPQERTIELEAEYGEAVIRNISYAYYKKTLISEDDFAFAEYFLEERGDFIAEGIGRVYKPGTQFAAESAQCQKLINKLRDICVAYAPDELDEPEMVEEVKTTPKKTANKTVPVSTWNWKANFEQTSLFSA